MNKVIQGDNIDVLKMLPDESIDLIYIDPPFNTGQTRTYARLRTRKDPTGHRSGFGGQKYTAQEISRNSFQDSFFDFQQFLLPRLEEAWRLLKRTGTLYFHIDYREVHYCKVLLDGIFGRECFLNEVIWAYDYGARSKTRWPCKHDNILVYVKDPEQYIFNYDEIDRIPYMAPDLVGPVKAAMGKTPTDVWWHTIVPTNGKERTGYPTQKPLGIVKRAILASSPSGGVVLDFFAGSGTTGEAALQTGRSFILIDNNQAAIDVMAKRFAAHQDVLIEGQTNEDESQ
jgi:site-specific DNA-methyltransferase (adenine-specific)